MIKIKQLFATIIGISLTLSPTMALTTNATEENNFSTLSASDIKPLPEQTTYIKLLPDNTNLQLLQDNSWKNSSVTENFQETDKLGKFYGLDTQTKALHTLNEQITSGPYESISSTNQYTILYTQGRNTPNSNLIILNSTNGQTVTTLEGLAKYPDSFATTPVNDTTFYAAKGSNLYKINALQGEKTDFSIQIGKGQSLTSPQFDKQTGILYLLQKGFKESSLKAWNTQNDQLIENFNINLLTPNVENFINGSKPRQILLDEAKRQLYVLYAPPFTSENKRHFLATYDLKINQFIGRIMQLGLNTVDLKIHPTSHEILAISSHENAIYLANPVTYKTIKALELEDYVVPVTKQDAPASAKANLFAITMNTNGTKAYALSPYETAVVSKEYSSAIEINIQPVSDVFNNTTDNEEPGNNTGDTTPPTTHTPQIPQTITPNLSNHNVTINNASMEWNFSDYAKAYWTDKLTPNAQKIGQDYKFTNGTGFANDKTGETIISFSGSVTFNPYSFIPNMAIIFANPVYERDKAGNDKVTFDMYWDLGDGKKRATQFKRLPVLVSSKPAHTIPNFTNGEKLTFPIAFDNVTYQDTNGTTHTGAWPTEFINNFITDMRPWWYKTGASRDEDKTPNPIQISLINIVKTNSNDEHLTNKKKLEKIAKENQKLIGNASTAIRCTLVDNGCVQSFANKNGHKFAIYVSDFSSGIVKLTGSIGKYYKANGWENGKLGYPTGKETTFTKDKWVQEFENAYVTYSKGKTHISYKTHPITNYYTENINTLFPTTNIKCGLKNIGCVQSFTNKQNDKIAVYLSQYTPVTPVKLTGSIGKYYKANGWENGKLGYPTGKETTFTKGKWVQEFENAYVTYSKGKTHISYKTHPITKHYIKNMNNIFPENNIKCGLKNNGCVQSFINKNNERNAIYYNKGKTIMMNLTNPISKHWITLGWENSKLGYPISEIKILENGYEQKFENGTIRFINNTLSVVQ